MEEVQVLWSRVDAQRTMIAMGEKVRRGMLMTMRLLVTVTVMVMVVVLEVGRLLDESSVSAPR